MNDINQAYVEKIRDAAHQGELYRVQTAQQATILGAGAALSSNPSDCIRAIIAHNDKAVEMLHTAQIRVNELQQSNATLREELLASHRCTTEVSAENRKLTEEMRHLRTTLEQRSAKEGERAWAWGQVWEKCMSIDRSMCHGNKTGARCVLDFIDSLAAKAAKFDANTDRDVLLRIQRIIEGSL